MDNEKTAKGNDYLGTAPIRKLLFQMSIPTVLAQLVNLLYSIVDRMYVGRIPEVGAQALAGLGITMPITILVAAFANLVGMGGAPRAAIAMGRKDKNQAEHILGNCVTLLVGLSIFLSVVFSVWNEPVLRAFGASDATLPYGQSYITIYLMGTIFVQLTLGLNMFITNQGFTKTSMATVCIGAVCNIILDPIFIFGFDMGVRGAALATVLSQAVSAVWVMKFLLGKKSILKIRKKNLKLSRSIVFAIISLGISPFVMNATECLLQMTFNRGMVTYGNDLYVALMSILFSVTQMIWLPMSGFTQGAQPIISYNFGAENWARVKKTFKMTFVICICFSIAMIALVEIFPQFFVGLFTNNTELIEMGKMPIRIFLLGMSVMGAQSACQQTFLALGEAKISMFLALLRKMILLIPLALILPKIGGLGLWGLFIAEPVSDVLAAATTTTMFVFKSKKLFQK